MKPEYPLRNDAAVSAVLPVGVAVNVPVAESTRSLSAASPTSIVTPYFTLAALKLVVVTAFIVCAPDRYCSAAIV